MKSYKSFDQSYTTMLHYSIVTIAVTVFTSSIEVFNGDLDGALIALNILIGRSFASIVALPDIVVFLKSNEDLTLRKCKKASVSMHFASDF